MKLTKPRDNPAFFIAAILLSVFLVTRIPIKKHLPYSAFTSDNIGTAIISLILICMLMLIIDKFRIPHSYYSSIRPNDYLYYLPALISILLLTNGLHQLSNMSGSTLYSGRALLYETATFARAFFEEILFRGVIFGVLLNKYHDSKHGISKSIFIASLIFGLAHIVNVWVYPERDASHTATQIYVATWLGVLYCATYVKTRSIIALGIIHFANNFLYGLKELRGYSRVIESVTRDSTTAEFIASQVFGLVYLAIPLFMGLFVMKMITREDIENMLGRNAL